MNHEFMKPKLDGARFREHTIPLEVLRDFTALEEMLIAVAKWEYLEDFPERTRVLRNFSQGLELHLAQVEDGSAIAAIVLAFSTLFPSHNATYFERARAQIVEAIASAEQGQRPSLPPALLSYFDKVGRGLRDDESMTFARADGTSARLTPEVRKRLIISAQVQEWTEEVSLRGKVCEIDQARGSFELELRDGTKLKAPLYEQHRAAVFDALRSYPSCDYVIVQAIAIKDRANRLKAIQSVEQINQLDPMDVAARMDELSLLKEGWLDGKGQALNRRQLDRLVTLFDSNYTSELPLPYIYPTAEGGVQAEWSIGPWEATLEIHLDTMIADYQAYDVEEDTTHEHVINLSDEQGWATLEDQLRAIGGAQA
jgi:hypothetical protein